MYFIIHLFSFFFLFFRRRHYFYKALKALLRTFVIAGGAGMRQDGGMAGQWQAGREGRAWEGPRGGEKMTDSGVVDSAVRQGSVQS